MARPYDDSEKTRRRFESTLIDERARLKARLDTLESEHQTLLGNVRRLQSSILTMQVQDPKTHSMGNTDEKGALLGCKKGIVPDQS